MSRSSRNTTRTYRIAERAATILLALCIPALFALLIWDLTHDPNPVPAVVTIAGLVMLCFFFSYVFVVPDDMTSSATDRTLAIASKIFVHTRHGLTPEASLGACKIILPETMAAAMCITDGRQVLASWGEWSERCPAGTKVVLDTTLRVMDEGQVSVCARDGQEDARFFPSLHAAIVAPITMRERCVGTLELYYPRMSSIDMRQRALAGGFADLLSTQLASYELDRMSEVSVHAELRALQSQVDPHFLFNTISTIVSLVRTEPEKARSLLIDFSNYYRQTLSDSEALTTLDRELEQGIRYINLMQARYGAERLSIRSDIDPATMDAKVPPFILQPLLENCIKHAMREMEPLSIVLTSQETDDGIEITVADDGVGMSEQVRTSLFEPREGAVEEPETITADGSVKRGCGLALSNVLTRIHFFFGDDSGIRVESQEGVGTKVIIELVGEPHESSLAAAKQALPSA